MRRGILLGLTLLLACASEVADRVNDAPTTSTASAIVNGSLDTTHGAVVTVVSSASNDEIAICTGTIVQTDPPRGLGWVATAAHCVSEGPPRAVFEGTDYLASDRVRHNVVGFTADSRFDINKPEAGYDFAVVRISGVTATTPIIPLATAPDSVVVGSSMTNIGYGRTTRPPADADTNSERHVVTAPIGEVSQLFLGYDTAQRGACQGDSGGPWLVGDGDTLRVVGIDSYGNTTCDGFAYAGRVQAGLDFFDVALGLAAPDPCALCTTLARSSGGKCASDKSAVCICNDACADECKGSTDCANVSTCIGNECDPSDASASTNSTPPTSDAGPDVVVVHQPGSGCSVGASRGSASGSFAWLLVALAVLRLRPSRSGRR
jgi:hypothetical protein